MANRCREIMKCRRFFFQAEDGIRDKLVTGVQTCALPIWRSMFFTPALAIRVWSAPVDVGVSAEARIPPVIQTKALRRLSSVPIFFATPSIVLKAPMLA